MGAFPLSLLEPSGWDPLPPGRAAAGRRPGLQVHGKAGRVLAAVARWLADAFDAPSDGLAAGDEHETQLVAAAKYGDPDAFDRLVSRHAPAMHAVARRLVGDDLASDVVQDSLLAAFKSMRRFRGDASFGTYLHGIVVNRCRRVGPRWRRAAAPAEMLDVASSDEPGPEAHAVARETREHIEVALRRLPGRYREALALREFGGLSYQEIAEIASVPVGTVRSRIARARGLMKDELQRLGVRP